MAEADSQLSSNTNGGVRKDCLLGAGQGEDAVPQKHNLFHDENKTFVRRLAWSPDGIAPGSFTPLLEGALTVALQALAKPAFLAF